MTTHVKLALAILGIAFLASCDEDDATTINPGTPVSVQLGNNLSIPENNGAKEIPVIFSGKATKDGQIILEVDSESEDAFQTNPAIEDGQLILDVTNGANGASFTITPADNNQSDAMRTVAFSIKSVSTGFVIGTNKNMTLSISDDESPVLVSFAAAADSLLENVPGGQTIQIQLSEPARSAGSVTLQLQGAAGILTTTPAKDANNRLELAVVQGAEVIEFKINPVNDQLLKGHKTIGLSITEVAGDLQKGTQISQSVKIFDDELRGKPKFYESFGGGWRTKDTYEYDEAGRISKIHWERATPGLTTGTYTYMYADNGLIEHVNHRANKDEYFFQENGRIVRSEIIENGVKTSYKLYDYDEAGNVGGMIVYYRQPDGEFLAGFIHVLLHYNTGNLYKQLVYIPGEEGEEPELHGTHTYDDYSEAINQFAFMQFIPNRNSQPNWPLTYQVEENGENNTYHFQYTFDESGNPVMRTIQETSDVTYYGYY